MIKVTHISKSFGSVKAVDDVSFEIKKGEVVGFLGPNGAGKTTTMRLLTGYLSLDEGEILLDDLSIATHGQQLKKKIGYLPENNPLYKEMLVSEFLTLSSELKGLKDHQRKEAFDFVVEAVNLDDVFYRPINELSKGYKQRVGMAAALLHQPEIVIMDEPTEGLDPNQRTEIRALIKKLAKERTIILSTHVMQEAAAVSNRLLIINKGKLVADGTPEEISAATNAERVMSLELQGSGIEEALTKMEGLQSFQIINRKKDRFVLQLLLDKKTAVQPVLSNLIHKNKWIVWRLQEEEYQLEDIFHKLTHE